MSENQIHFFASMPHACGYLPDRHSTSVFADPNGPMSMELYNKLIDAGFRRSGNHVYRPHCSDCNACVPARIVVNQFTPSRSQKRIWKRNADLTVHAIPGSYQEEHYRLYQRYVQNRHAGGGMDNPTPSRYRDFLLSHWCHTILYEFRLEKQLLAVAVTDKINTGLSAFYTFYDPNYAQRGLGIYAILWQIHAAKKHYLPWVYLGYWIQECAKMNYKIQYQPLEYLYQGTWQTGDLMNNNPSISNT